MTNSPHRFARHTGNIWTKQKADSTGAGERYPTNEPKQNVVFSISLLIVAFQYAELPDAVRKSLQERIWLSGNESFGICAYGSALFAYGYYGHGSSNEVNTLLCSGSNCSSIIISLAHIVQMVFSCRFIRLDQLFRSVKTSFSGVEY